jgi:sulfide:quinone oxidoreductase
VGSRAEVEVLIAGGGFAGLEALLALRALAEQRLAVELLAPDAEFVYRPAAVTARRARSTAPRTEITLVTPPAKVAGLSLAPFLAENVDLAAGAQP